jgi:hypothetical protein
MFGRYVPEVHTGTREQRVLGYLREYADIGNDGAMRMHAQEREQDRIAGELAALGVEVWIGDGADEGYILGREATAPHGPRCHPPERCECTVYPWRLAIDEDEEAYRAEEQARLEAAVARARMGAGTTYSGNRTIPLEEPDGIVPMSAGLTSCSVYAVPYRGTGRRS